MIKILILFAIIVLTTMIGVLLSSTKKKRKEVFSELYEFNERLILNLHYARNPISSISEKFKYIPDILKGNKILDGNDWETINDYTVNLGKTDAMSQIDYLNERRSVLAKYKDESINDYKKYSSLYVKIFFMIGILIAVLLA